MPFLRIAAAPHYVVKDAEARQAEKEELLSEQQAFLSALLECNPEVSLVIRSTPAVEGAKVVFGYEVARLSAGLEQVLQSLKRVPVKVEPNVVAHPFPPRQEDMVARRVEWTTVGAFKPLNEYPRLLAADANPSLEKVYRCPFVTPFNLLSDASRWRHVCEALAARSGELRITLRRFTPQAYDLAYAKRFVQFYAHSYRNVLAEEEYQDHTRLARGTLIGGNVWQVAISVTGESCELLKFAFLRDTNFEALRLAPTKISEEELSVIWTTEMREAFMRSLNLWTREEITTLCAPPYSFDDPLNFPHFVPKPFIVAQPDTNGADDEANSISVGRLENGADARIPLLDMTRHVFVTGMPGAGKTRTIFRLVRQLLARGVPVLIFDPVKTEYEELFHECADLIPEAKGDARRRIIEFQERSLYFNAFVPPPNITFYSHAVILARALSLFFPTNAVAYELMLDMARATYWKKFESYYGKGKFTLNWFLQATLKSLPAQQTAKLIPTFDEFLTLGLERLSEMSFEEGAQSRFTREALEHFKRRWAILEQSMFKAILTPKHPLTSIYSLFDSTALVELHKIIDRNESNALFALLLSLLAEYRQSQGLSDKLKHVTVIEELHRVAPAHPENSGPELMNSPQQEAAQMLAQMLAEARAWGEGIILSEQSFSKVIPEAAVNTATKIMHRINYGVDKDRLKSALSLSERESEHLAYLTVQRGAYAEALAFLPSSYYPLYLRVPPK